MINIYTIFSIQAIHILFVGYLRPARGGKCSVGGIVPNTAFTFRVFVATPRSLSYLCIFSSFYLALNLHIQVVNSPSYSITWIFLSKFLTDDDNFCNKDTSSILNSNEFFNVVHQYREVLISFEL